MNSNTLYWVMLSLIIAALVATCVASYYGQTVPPYDTTITVAKVWQDNQFHDYYVSTVDGQTFGVSLGRWTPTDAGILFGKFVPGKTYKVHVGNFIRMFSGQAIRVIVGINE